MAQIKYYPSSKRIKLPFNGRTFFKWLNDTESFILETANRINRDKDVKFFQSVTFSINQLTNLSNNASNDIIVFLPVIKEESGKKEATLAAFEAEDNNHWFVKPKETVLVSTDTIFFNKNFKIQHNQIARHSTPLHDKLNYDWSFDSFKGSKSLADLVYKKPKTGTENLLNNRCVTGIFYKSELNRLMVNGTKYLSIHPFKATCTTVDKETEKNIKTDDYITFLTLPLDSKKKPILIKDGKANTDGEAYFLESMWNPHWKKWTNVNREAI